MKVSDAENVSDARVVSSSEGMTALASTLDILHSVGVVYADDTK